MCAAAESSLQIDNCYVLLVGVRVDARDHCSSLIGHPS